MSRFLYAGGVFLLLVGAVIRWGHGSTASSTAAAAAAAVLITTASYLKFR